MPFASVEFKHSGKRFYDKIEMEGFEWHSFIRSQNGLKLFIPDFTFYNLVTG